MKIKGWSRSLARARESNATIKGVSIDQLTGEIVLYVERAGILDRMTLAFSASELERLDSFRGKASKPEIAPRPVVVVAPFPTDAPRTVPADPDCKACATRARAGLDGACPSCAVERARAAMVKLGAAVGLGAPCTKCGRPVRDDHALCATCTPISD